MIDTGKQISNCLKNGTIEPLQQSIPNVIYDIPDGVVENNTNGIAYAGNDIAKPIKQF